MTGVQTCALPISGDPGQDRLDTLNREFDALTQDSITHRRNRGAIAAIRETLEPGKSVNASLEKLVGTLFQNLALFRS